MAQEVKFQGFKLEQNESGWFAGDIGYCDTREELEGLIDDFNSDLRSDENVYGLASIQQSIEEDRAR